MDDFREALEVIGRERPKVEVDAFQRLIAEDRVFVGFEGEYEQVQVRRAQEVLENWGGKAGSELVSADGFDLDRPPTEETKANWCDDCGLVGWQTPRGRGGQDFYFLGEGDGAKCVCGTCVQIDRG